MPTLALCPTCDGPLRGFGFCPGCHRGADPGPAEIRQMCRLIQSEWTDVERDSRACGADWQALLAVVDRDAAEKRRCHIEGRREAMERRIRRAALRLSGVYGAALATDWTPGPEWE